MGCDWKFNQDVSFMSFTSDNGLIFSVCYFVWFLERYSHVDFWIDSWQLNDDANNFKSLCSIRRNSVGSSRNSPLRNVLNGLVHIYQLQICIFGRHFLRNLIVLCDLVFVSCPLYDRMLFSKEIHVPRCNKLPFLSTLFLCDSSSCSYHDVCMLKHQ